MRLPKSFPPKVETNPDNALVRPAGEAVSPEPHHEAVHAVSRAQQRTRLLAEATYQRRLGREARAAKLEAEAGAS